MRRVLQQILIMLLVLAGLAAGAVSCGLRGDRGSNRRSGADTTGNPEDGNVTTGVASPTETVSPGGETNLSGTPAVTPTPDVRRKSRTKPEGTIPVVKPGAISRAADGELKVIWLGHSSSLVQMGSVNLLFDPVLSKKIGVLGVGPRRFSEVPVAAEDMPEIDILFLSHDHYDHLDYDSVLALDSRVGCYVVPDGIDGILQGWGIEASKIYAMQPWEAVTIAGVTLTFTPAQHSGGRGLGAATLCVGVHVADASHTLFYTGDGGYAKHFSEVYERLGAVDLLLAESGQYNEGWASVHMMPEQSVQVALDVHAAWMIPVHWGAFVLSTHDWDEPPRRDTELAAKLGVRIATPRIGEIVDLREIGNYTERWWEK
ncbi:MAG: MBL fold metallo-hydrolase [Lachnospiraceae bacterium]|nr:MBL fold metallo-hydrolase [Lachnospiraceae bacterium]